MATLDQLNKRLEQLKTALASGVTLIHHGDTRVQYRSVAEIRQAIGAIESERALIGGSQVVRSIKLTSSKDL